MTGGQFDRSPVWFGLAMVVLGAAVASGGWYLTQKDEPSGGRDLGKVMLQARLALRAGEVTRLESELRGASPTASESPSPSGGALTGAVTRELAYLDRRLRRIERDIGLGTPRRGPEDDPEPVEETAAPDVYAGVLDMGFLLVHAGDTAPADVGQWEIKVRIQKGSEIVSTGKLEMVGGRESYDIGLGVIRSAKSQVRIEVDLLEYDGGPDKDWSCGGGLLKGPAILDLDLTSPASLEALCGHEGVINKVILRYQPWS